MQEIPAIAYHLAARTHPSGGSRKRSRRSFCINGEAIRPLAQARGGTASSALVSAPVGRLWLCVPYGPAVNLRGHGAAATPGTIVPLGARNSVTPSAGQSEPRIREASRPRRIVVGQAR